MKQNMLSPHIQEIYRQIVIDAHKLVFSFIDKEDLTGKVNYASIFAHSDEEFVEFTKDIEANGTIFNKQPSGSYYLLNTPIDTDFGEITICRVRSYDDEHLERGYLVFETVDYTEFKKKYLPKPYFHLMELPHVELVELHAPNHTVRAYFPDSM